MDTSAGKKRDFSRKRKRFAVKVSLLKESALSFEHIPGISPVMTKSCYVQVDASYSLVTRREDITAGKYFQQAEQKLMFRLPKRPSFSSALTVR
jgi:hypothetical protein